MRTVLPRKIPVADVFYKVRIDRKTMESECNFEKREITIGTKRCCKQDKLNKLLHEALEAICEERKLRYDRSYLESEAENNESYYILSHDDLNMVVSDLVNVLKKVKWNNKEK